MKFNSIFSLCLLLMGLFAMTSCDKEEVDNPDNESVTMLYTSNNSDGDIGQYEFKSSGEVKISKFVTPSSAADGIYYDEDDDEVVQASRSSLTLEGFTNISNILETTINLNIDLLGTDKMMSPREMAVNGDLYVVADNMDVDGNAATPDGKFFIYEKTSQGFNLRNVITTDIKLWGITFIGNDLYAVVDADDELAVYENFLSNNSNTTLSPTKRVVIEGIVRTHGITYDAATGTLVMTDIGSATNTQDDGGFHIIKNFMTKFNAASNGGMIALADQIRVAGTSTLMGNPVDVAYDGAADMVYIAEAGNGGGRILAFANASAGGNKTPDFNSNLAAASAVYLHKN
ncbi:MAG: hypothetical protein KDC49_22510 [Saprospiraceae bacterium]|nr:hypothetical protein [Saprospiraceae bacterium]